MTVDEFLKTAYDAHIGGSSGLAVRDFASALAADSELQSAAASKRDELAWSATTPTRCYCSRFHHDALSQALGISA